MSREHAQALRTLMTDAERRLWRHLRAHRLLDCKFRRQQMLGPYIVDFVCFEARLIVEVDGGQHASNAPDRVRDRWLRARGYQVLRFWNNDVLKNTEGVLQRIFDALAPSPQPLSREGRGAEEGSRTSSACMPSFPSPLAGEGAGERGE